MQQVCNLLINCVINNIIPHVRLMKLNFLQRLRYSLRFRRALQRAEEAHRQNGHQYYVMPIHKDKRCRLIVMNRADFRAFKKKRIVSPKATMYNMLRECFYRTPDKSGSGYLTPEQIAIGKQKYLNWCEAMHNSH